ncbi:MAG: energy-coupling factor ABC transporter ATP-binding protein [Alphaproteobacteria bacterium]
MTGVAPPLIAVDGVTVARAGRVVLDAVSFALHAGEKVALVGPNGAGKTTLLRTLVGLETPEAGTLSAFGTVRRQPKEFREVRAKAGYLFQDADDQLFCPTVLDDVAFGPLNLGLAPREAAAKANAVLAELGLDHLAGRATHRLSGGEKRLVSLAAVLAMEPEALLLDEPTNGLDEAHFARLTEILAALPTAMLIVSHDGHFLAKLATRALLLRDGRLGPTLIHRHPHAHEHAHIHGVDADHRHHEAAVQDIDSYRRPA